jgi:hypothetical protein
MDRARPGRTRFSYSLALPCLLALDDTQTIGLYYTDETGSSPVCQRTASRAIQPEKIHVPHDRHCVLVAHVEVGPQVVLCDLPRRLGLETAETASAGAKLSLFERGWRE